jgi:hypothetical protein
METFKNTVILKPMAFRLNHWKVDIDQLINNWGHYSLNTANKDFAQAARVF